MRHNNPHKTSLVIGSLLLHLTTFSTQVQLLEKIYKKLMFPFLAEYSFLTQEMLLPIWVRKNVLPLYICVSNFHFISLFINIVETRISILFPQSVCIKLRKLWILKFKYFRKQQVVASNEAEKLKSREIKRWKSCKDWEKIELQYVVTESQCLLSISLLSVKNRINMMF